MPPTISNVGFPINQPGNVCGSFRLLEEYSRVGFYFGLFAKLEQPGLVQIWWPYSECRHSDGKAGDKKGEDHCQCQLMKIGRKGVVDKIMFGE